jgi:hypothetical protein
MMTDDVWARVEALKARYGGASAPGSEG